MIKMSKLFFNSDKLEKEIEHFESEVDFEFIPVIAQRSIYTGHVFGFLILALLLLSEVTVDVLSITMFQDSWANQSLYSFILKVLCFPVAYLLSKINWVNRILVSKKSIRRQVNEKAKLVFFLKRLHEVKSQNALLVFVSILEKRIVILPDPRNNLTSIDQLTDEALKILQKNFKQDDFEKGLIEVVHHMKSQLKTQSPRLRPLENEFSNKLIWWN